MWGPWHRGWEDACQSTDHLQGSRFTPFPQVRVLQADSTVETQRALERAAPPPRLWLQIWTSHVTMSYLIKDILVFGEDRPGEEVLNGTEVQDLVTNGHADPWSWLGGRRDGQHRKSLGCLGSFTRDVQLRTSPQIPQRWP